MASKYKCDICEGPVYDVGRHHGMCAPCAKSYDRYSHHTYGDVMQALIWAARRARRVLFARLRRQGRLKR